MVSSDALARTSALTSCLIFALSLAGVVTAGPTTDRFQYIIENEIYQIENHYENEGMEVPSTPEPESSPPAPTGPSRAHNPDFIVSISPSSRTITRGESASYTVTVRSIDGFAGTVSLSASGTPSSSNYSLPPSVDVQSNGAAILTITISTKSSTPTGSYTLTVTGMNGGLTRSANAALVITDGSTTSQDKPDFTVDISPDSRTIINKITVNGREVEEHGSGLMAVRVNRQASYTVTVTSINGFTGTVSLGLTGLPANASAPLPSSIDVPRNGAAIVALTVTTTSSTPGSAIGYGKSYTLTVTGTHDGVTRSDSAELYVEEKTIYEGSGGRGGPVYDDGLSGSSGYASSVTRSYAWRVNPSTGESMYFHHTDRDKWRAGMPLSEWNGRGSMISPDPVIPIANPPSRPIWGLNSPISMNLPSRPANNQPSTSRASPSPVSPRLAPIVNAIRALLMSRFFR